MMTATLENDVGPEDFGISTMDAEKARHYAAFLVAAERERCAVTWEKLAAAARPGEKIDDTLRRYGDVIRGA